MNLGILKEFSKDDLENIFELKPEGKRNLKESERLFNDPSVNSSIPLPFQF